MTIESGWRKRRMTAQNSTEFGQAEPGPAISPEQALEADVVVVGGGASGMAAALSAAEAGSSVILLEKAAHPGGTTSLSVGSISVNRSPFQKAIGIEDNPDAHFEDMGKLAGALAERDNLELRRLYVDNISAVFDWLLDHGLVFHGPFEEPPHHRVPRMHLILPNSGAYTRRLAYAAAKRKVLILTNTRASRLISENGRISGLFAHIGVPADLPLEELDERDPNGSNLDRSGMGGSGLSRPPREIRARKGVVLATGDFSSGTALKQRYLAPEEAPVAAVNPLSTGDGHVLGMQQGATMRNADLVWRPQLRFPPPPNSFWASRMPPWPPLLKLGRFAFRHLPGPIVRHIMARFLTSFLSPSPGLIKAGALLVDETGRIADPGISALNQRGSNTCYYIVFDENIGVNFRSWPGFISTFPGTAYAYLDDYLRMRPDVITTAASPEQMAKTLGMEPETFAASFAQQAAPSADGRNEPVPALRAPFYALGPLTHFIVFTDGGLGVSTRMEVLDEGGSPILGLFAAGSAGQGGVVLNGHGHHIGWALVSGRLAGRAAAAETAI